MEDELIDFTDEGIETIGNKIWLYTKSAIQLSKCYRNHFRAYLKNAIYMLDEADKKETQASTTDNTTNTE